MFNACTCSSFRKIAKNKEMRCRTGDVYDKKF